MKYVLLTEIRTNEDGWWIDRVYNTEAVRFFDSFEAAKTAMRETVKQVVQTSGLFIFEDGIEELGMDEEATAEMDRIISETISDPGYFCDGSELNIKEVDYAAALIANKDVVLADGFGKTLNMNIHVMNDAEKPYYFSYSVQDEDDESARSVAVRLYNDAKQGRREAPKWPKW